MTEQEAKDFLQIEDKLVVRPFGWVIQAGGYTPQVRIFESALMINGEVKEEVLLRASYRGEKRIQKGQAEIVLPESFSCALFIGGLRIAALDTNPAQKHTNKVGVGRPYYGQIITSATHRHLWVGEYGYVEPVDPALLDIVQLLQVFADECRLSFQGLLEHPLKGEQGELI